MCDGSALPYEENVAWTARMAAKAHALVRSGCFVCMRVNAYTHAFYTTTHDTTHHLK